MAKVCSAQKARPEDSPFLGVRLREGKKARSAVLGDQRAMGQDKSPDRDAARAPEPRRPGACPRNKRELRGGICDSDSPVGLRLATRNVSLPERRRHGLEVTVRSSALQAARMEDVVDVYGDSR